MCLQGFHFKYASIRGQISRPLFALIPPCTLMLHSSKGIQFLELKQYAMPRNPNCSLSNTQQLSHHSTPLQAAAANSEAVLSQPGTAPADIKQQQSSVCTSLQMFVTWRHVEIACDCSTGMTNWHGLQQVHQSLLRHLPSWQATAVLATKRCVMAMMAQLSQVAHQNVLWHVSSAPKLGIFRQLAAIAIQHTIP